MTDLLTSNERVALLERIARLATELCVSVDKAAEDIGGERPALEILRDIGPLTDQLEKLGPEPAAGVGVIDLAGSPSPETTAEWQPIKTAPHSGVAVLLWQPWKSGRDCTVIGHYANGWVDRNCEEFQPEPTHWMPLPASPAKAAAPSGHPVIACIYRDGCRKFPACMNEARCCGRDTAIPETRDATSPVKTSTSQTDGEPV